MLAASGASAADLAPASVALCRPAEQVMFHCSLGASAVSVCAAIDGGRIASLTWREGGPRRLVQSAGTHGASRFHAGVGTAAPGADVRQLWLRHGATVHLLTQCIGGACPYDAGLATLRGDRVLTRGRCQRTADDRNWFAPELAHFGRDAATSTSTTDRVVIDDVDNGVERLYPIP